MSESWLLVEVEDSILKDRPLGDGLKLRYLVSPSMGITKEERSVDEVVRSASDQGFEVYYTGIGYSGVQPWVWRDAEDRVLRTLRKELGKNVRSFDVSISPVARLTRNSP